VTVSVSVPATASNLGGGFDCVGVAVHKRLRVTVGIATEGPPITIERAGTLAAQTIRNGRRTLRDVIAPEDNTAARRAV